MTRRPTYLFLPAFAQGCGVLRVDVCNALILRVLGGGIAA